MNKFNHACTYAFIHGGSAVKSAGRKVRDRINEVKNDESGMEIIAVVLILVVVIALAVVFKDNIAKIFNNLWDKITDTLNGDDNSTAFDTGDAAEGKNFVALFNNIA
ncbi:MAG: hypothetical protein E7493_11155 [Ruminococcus albus]|jgi:Flp pilus assembly pilin Flp|nr:hypothetical protein [Ruminococcus albus]